MLSDLIHWKIVWSDAMDAAVIHGVSNTHTNVELRAFNRRMSRLRGMRLVAYRKTRS